MEKQTKGKTNGIDKMVCELAFNSMIDENDLFELQLNTAGGVNRYTAEATIDKYEIQTITVIKNGKKLVGQARYDMADDAKELSKNIGF